jgi:hypothetical protein
MQNRRFAKGLLIKKISWGATAPLQFPSLKEAVRCGETSTAGGFPTDSSFNGGSPRNGLSSSAGDWRTRRGIPTAVCSSRETRPRGCFPVVATAVKWRGNSLRTRHCFTCSLPTQVNHIYIENHSYKSSGSILLSTGSSGLLARTTPGFKMDKV